MPLTICLWWYHGIMAIWSQYYTFVFIDALWNSVFDGLGQAVLICPVLKPRRWSSSATSCSVIVRVVFHYFHGTRQWAWQTTVFGCVGAGRLHSHCEFAMWNRHVDQFYVAMPNITRRGQLVGTDHSSVESHHQCPERSFHSQVCHACWTRANSFRERDISSKFESRSIKFSSRWFDNPSLCQHFARLSSESARLAWYGYRCMYMLSASDFGMYSTISSLSTGRPGQSSYSSAESSTWTCSRIDYAWLRLYVDLQSTRAAPKLFQFRI